MGGPLQKLGWIVNGIRVKWRTHAGCRFNLSTNGLLSWTHNSFAVLDDQHLRDRTNGFCPQAATIGA